MNFLQRQFPSQAVVRMDDHWKMLFTPFESIERVADVKFHFLCCPRAWSSNHKKLNSNYYWFFFSLCQLLNGIFRKCRSFRFFTHWIAFGDAHTAHGIQFNLIQFCNETIAVDFLSILFFVLLLNFEKKIWLNYFTQIHTTNKMSRTTINYNTQLSTECEDGSDETEMDVPISMGKCGQATWKIVQQLSIVSVCGGWKWIYCFSGHNEKKNPWIIQLRLFHIQKNIRNERTVIAMK